MTGSPRCRDAVQQKYGEWPTWTAKTLAVAKVERVLLCDLQIISKPAVYASLECASCWLLACSFAAEVGIGYDECI